MKETDYENLGSRIKELRLQMNLTQADVASALGVTPGYICNVENNRSAMSLRVLTYYAELMHVSLDSLVGNFHSDYLPTALDNELTELISRMNIEQKTKLIETIKIWQEK